MTSTVQDNYTLLQDDQDGVCDFATFLTKIHEGFADQNLVIDLLKYNEMSLQDLLCYLSLSNTHRAGKKSLVIVNDAVPVDEIPDELLVVPTIQEAQDVIEMEEIERDLGF
ncbi:ribonuclease Z [Nonlabens ponticola]|uniref:Ribonuclease Z n=1 Tax=Nonlabens ponticola TaxID=2496866 RepID=A0A3S9MZR6_9FLAO|nr:ribonuclease Z [Nonlabens ponticola]AZQ44563.1 ribonuclease Z [Nonlabens ponticola]